MVVLLSKKISWHQFSEYYAMALQQYPQGLALAQASETQHRSDAMLRCRDHFSIAGIEVLPVHLRERVLKFQIRVSSEQLPVNVDYILSAGHEALLGTMSWMQVVRMHQDDITPPAQIAAQVDLRHQVVCVCGPAGAGKSHVLAKQVAGLGNSCGSVTVNEGFTAAELIQNLSEAVSRNQTAPFIQLLVSSYALMTAVNHLLFQLLVEGVVADPATGAAFAFLPDTSAVIQVEIPAAVMGEPLQQLPHACNDPALQGPDYGMLLHMPVLADLCTTGRQWIWKVSMDR